MLKKLARITKRCADCTALVSGVFLTAVMCLIVVNIIARRFFDAPIFGVTELVRYGALLAASFALIGNEWCDGNIKMMLILEHLSEKKRALLDAVTGVMSVCGFGYVCWHLSMQVLYKYSKGELSVDLAIPLWILAGILAFGMILLALCVVVKTVLSLYTVLTGEKIPTERATEELDVSL
jgi:TRAP-type C4-dicarboxylate transport system permease small subunit